MAEQSNEIYGVNTMSWVDSSWKHLLLIGDEEVISLQRTRVYVFSDSVLCRGKIHENPKVKRCIGRQIGVVQLFTGIQRLGQS